jgi:hypothetical protein
MTILANTFLTFDAKGIREDLADAIYDISPEDTPLVSMMNKVTSDQTLTEWQTDALRAPATNAHVEGDDITSFTAVVATVRVGNYQQILQENVIISGTTEATKRAGRGSEVGYQVARRGKEVKRDLEFACFQNQEGVVGSETTARRFAALLAWIKTNVDKAAGDGANPNYTSGVPLGVGGSGPGRDDGTQRAFTETILKSVLQKGWTNGATIEGKYFFLGPVNKQKFSGFGGNATKTMNISDRPARQMAILAGADMYSSDWGVITIVPSRWQRERDGFLIDPDFLALSHLRPFRVEDLAKTGDTAAKKLLVEEVTLQVRQEAALGLAADLTTT